MKNPEISVCLSPIMLAQYDLTDRIVVVIDVLRATSTICVALENGAKEVIPVVSVEDCRKYQGQGYVLAGERGGIQVEGFDFGNSPFEYMNGEVSGKTLVLTTTNGTRSIELAKNAYTVAAGSFLNLDLICGWLKELNKDVLLLCAGWKDKFSLEDTIMAGAITQKLKDHFNLTDDATLAAELLYDSSKDDLHAAVKNASHYKRLAGLGIEKDIEYCLIANQVQVIPILRDGRFRKR